MEQLIGTQFGLVVAFIATALVVIASGVRLSIYGDALGDRTGLGSGLIGLIFLAAVTSLPELVVSLTSVLKATDPQLGADLAVGNMLGSNVFNLIILALLAILAGKKFIPAKLESPHTASAIYGLILLAIFCVAFFMAPRLSFRVPILQCGIFTLMLPIAYGFILRRENQKQSEKKEEEHLPSEATLTSIPASRFYSTLSLLCLLIVGGGIALSILGSRMALPPEQGGFGLEASIIGTLFLAISTSLPELVISFSSVRLGFLDMSVGNVLGSNMFNLLIIFAADVAMRGQKLLDQASAIHWNTVGLIFLLTLFSMALLRTTTRKGAAFVAWTMVISYLAVFLFSPH